MSSKQVASGFRSRTPIPPCPAPVWVYVRLPGSFLFFPPLKQISVSPKERRWESPRVGVDGACRCLESSQSRQTWKQCTHSMGEMGNGEKNETARGGRGMATRGQMRLRACHTSGVRPWDGCGKTAGSSEWFRAVPWFFCRKWGARWRSKG